MNVNSKTLQNWNFWSKNCAEKLPFFNGAACRQAYIFDLINNWEIGPNNGTKNLPLNQNVHHSHDFRCYGQMAVLGLLVNQQIDVPESLNKLAIRFHPDLLGIQMPNPHHLVILQPEKLCFWISHSQFACMYCNLEQLAIKCLANFLWLLEFANTFVLIGWQLFP